MKKNEIAIMFILSKEQAEVWKELVSKLDTLRDIFTQNDDPTIQIATEDKLAKGIFLIGLDTFMKMTNFKPDGLIAGDGETLH